MRIHNLLLALLLAAAVACRSTGDDRPSDGGAAPRTGGERGGPGEASGALSEAERRHLLEADLVLVGTIAELGPEAPCWSNGGLSYQVVVYDLEDVLRGRYSRRERYGPTQIAIHHILVAKSRTAHPDRPGLSPEIFRSGRRVIVAARLEESWDERCRFEYVWLNDAEEIGVLDADSRTLDAVRRLFRDR